MTTWLSQNSLVCIVWDHKKGDVRPYRGGILSPRFGIPASPFAFVPWGSSLCHEFRLMRTCGVSAALLPCYAPCRLVEVH